MEENDVKDLAEEFNGEVVDMPEDQDGGHMETIGAIMGEMQRRVVQEREPIPAKTWLDRAMRLNVLTENVDDMIAEMECAMSDKEIELLEAGESAAASKKLKKKAVDYEKFLKLEALRKRITEFIRLSKKQAQAVNDYDPSLTL